MGALINAPAHTRISIDIGPLDGGYLGGGWLYTHGAHCTGKESDYGKADCFML